MRNVLGHLGLAVTRLIRVSFGPFQLGELAEGEVEEVPTRVLREQLGERIAALSRADFSAPVVSRAQPQSQEAPKGSAAAIRPSHADAGPSPSRQTEGSKIDRSKISESFVRAHEPEGAAKKLRRKFRGGRRAAEKRDERSAGEPRAGLLTNRKGRPVPVERFGQAPKIEPDKIETRKSDRHSRRRSPDRASGPRPRRPRGIDARRRRPAARRPIAAPKSKAIRPTADRLRESLFNILVHSFDDPVTGARVLDLFAGTGALGIEALSRGAAFVLFVDEGAEARALLRENVVALGLGGTSKIFAATRPSLATPIRTLHFRSPSSIRLMATASPPLPLPRRAPAAGSRPMP